MKSLSKYNQGIKYLLCAIGSFNKYAVVCINRGAGPHFRPHFFRFFNISIININIRKFLTPFVLLIHSFYTNNISFLNIWRESSLVPPFIHTTLMRYNKININNHQ